MNVATMSALPVGWTDSVTSSTRKWLSRARTCDMKNTSLTLTPASGYAFAFFFITSVSVTSPARFRWMCSGSDAVNAQSSLASP